MKKQVTVKPNSKVQSLTEAPDGSLMIRLKSPPVDGKANQELIQFLAKTYGVSKSQVRITHGLSSRHKWLEIELNN
ncbi:DUF167 domain-containing protein [Spirulina subsalsa FACHB-351]|uniref:UPF0235 protein K4A83_03645 n=1 Tax=Spirulina subsalsa FACHB-351 TaxID=234711 RepID=A0ABT3L1J0_9CYAN|nr:DUF167 domain-containing protein [Spirulina subsalsa]MCW6035369.1 DUF167 domain-containing protein [Spirulina subsalsa FACHB-351]